MKKQFIYSLAATFITAALALGSLTACSSEDLVTEKQSTQAKTYTVSIPATMGDDTRAVTFDAGGTDNPTAVSSFTTTDKIYVYNQTKGAMLSGNLTPSANGKTCDLTGELTGTIAAGDELVLLYNLSHYNSKDKTQCGFSYGEQNGTQEGVIDGAKATVTASVDNDNLHTATAHFQNMQSMFRFQFTSNSTLVSVKSVLISSQKSALAFAYWPLNDNDKFDWGKIRVTLPSVTNNPIYVAMCIDESKSAGDELTFEVVDATGKLYTTTKAAPTGGFVNGKYYYNTTPIDLGDYKLQLEKPSLSRSDGGYNSELADADAARCFHIYSPSWSGAGAAQDITMSMSGTSTGYWFYLWSDAVSTVNISGLTATFDDNATYIDSYNSLTLNISGDNTISCKNNDYCIFAPSDLKLSGNGTLTVTANSATYYGLRGNNYDGSDVSTLAAPGYTVTRSATQNNGDGTYTWTYTVATNLYNVTTRDGNNVLYYAAQDGDVLIGDFNYEYGYVTIPDGATVTLSDVDIWTPDNCDHAAIHCLGSANIIVSGTSNNVAYGGSGHNDNYPAIYVPSGSTLTISGSGTLNASCINGKGAGIGGGYYIPCGNIVLSGATINAYGGPTSAAIGSGGHSSSGNIAINSGTVTAQGGQGGTGIGCGFDGSCGTITINSGITSVVARMGYNGYSQIGKSAENSTCGTVTIDGVANAITSSTFTHLNSAVTTNTLTNDTWTLTHK